jgi:hypothetical protein
MQDTFVHTMRSFRPCCSRWNRQVAELVLGDVQHRQQGGLLVRILRERLVDALF